MDRTTNLRRQNSKFALKNHTNLIIFDLDNFFSCIRVNVGIEFQGIVKPTNGYKFWAPLLSVASWFQRKIQNRNR